MALVAGTPLPGFNPGSSPKMFAPPGRVAGSPPKLFSNAVDKLRTKLPDVAQGDPFANMLLPSKKFDTAADREQYMAALAQKLDWILALPVATVVSDALLSDFPIVQVSDQFLQETKYKREEVMFTNCRFLLENVSGPDLFRVSRSSRAAIRAFCQLARFPKAVSGGADKECRQPNCMADGQIVMNDFTMRRAYVNGHPLIVGVQHFRPCGQTSDGRSDPEALRAESARFTREDDAHLDAIVGRMQQDKDLHALLQVDAENAPVSSPDPKISPDVLWRGEGRGAPKNTLFYGGSGLLRQEPDTLPHSGIICTQDALQLDDAGCIRFSLRVETTAKWSDYPPMGFTQTEPWADTFPEALQLSPRTVCFAAIGAVVNETDRATPPTTRPKAIDVEQQCLPRLREGDLVTVELAVEDMELRRYVNGVRVTSVRMPYRTEETTGKAWYGCFQVSFSVSRAKIEVDSPSRTLADGGAGPEVEEPNPQDQHTDDLETEYLTAELANILDGVEDISITIASAEDDFPLIAVSSGFERLTGYAAEDIVGRNCRFLNTGSEMEPADRMGIRTALATGARFTTVVPNLRKDLSPFLNLLDLRTLEIGTQRLSGAPVRVVVGIQGEVDAGRNSSHWRAELPGLTARVREKIRQKLGERTRILAMDSGATVAPHREPFWVDDTEQPEFNSPEPLPSPAALQGKVLESPSVESPQDAAGLSTPALSIAVNPFSHGVVATRAVAWTPEAVGAFLLHLDLPMYVDVFAAERVDGEVMLDLDQESLADLGVKKHHQKKLLRAIDKLRA